MGLRTSRRKGFWNGPGEPAIGTSQPQNRVGRKATRDAVVHFFANLGERPVRRHDRRSFLNQALFEDLECGPAFEIGQAAGAEIVENDEPGVHVWPEDFSLTRVETEAFTERSVEIGHSTERRGIVAPDSLANDRAGKMRFSRTHGTG